MELVLIIGGIIGLAVGGLIGAILLRAAAQWVARLDIPFRKAFGLALALAAVNGGLGFIFGAGLAGGDTPRWLPFVMAYLMGLGVAGIVLSQSLSVRYGKAVLIQLISSLLGSAIVAVVVAVYAVIL